MVLCIAYLFIGQVALGIFIQLLGKDEQAVEGRTQLVGHIGQELRFVLGGKGKLLGFFFQ